MNTAQIPVETLEGRLALKVARVLSENADRVPHDIGERLRTAREAALRARKPESELAAQWQVDGRSATLVGGPSGSRWANFVIWVPLLVLAVGIYLIQHLHQESQVAAAADVDAALLSDDLPPDAYSDAGFLEFLKLPPP